MQLTWWNKSKISIVHLSPLSIIGLFTYRLSPTKEVAEPVELEVPIVRTASNESLSDKSENSRKSTPSHTAVSWLSLALSHRFVIFLSCIVKQLDNRLWSSTWRETIYLEKKCSSWQDPMCNSTAASLGAKPNHVFNYIVWYKSDDSIIENYV